MWLFPLINWNGIIPTGNHPGSFGVRRKHDVHCGVDLYVPGKDTVCAVENGVVVAIEDYTGPEAGSPWWLPTKSILIEGNSGVVCYGEIEPVDLQVGNIIIRGQRLATVTPVLKKFKQRKDIPGHSRFMLHFELYQPGTRESVWWHLNEERPSNLLDPTKKLLEAYNGSR